MPFLLLRTASVLATGFLLAGPSSPAATSAGSATGSLSAGTSACPAQWTAGQLHISSWSQQPAGLNSQIMSVAAVSPTDEWMLITRTNNHGSNVSAVYHLVGTERLESVDLAAKEKSFAAKWIVARSDTDVWVIGSARGALEAWRYDGSSWTDHPPARHSRAVIDAAALGRDGILYLAGSNGPARKGIILSYDGTRWADSSPANPPSDYQALAVTSDGTLVAAGGGHSDGTLQERSGTRWTTVSLSAPVSTVTRVSVAPDGTVFGIGTVAGNQSALIVQAPGGRTATVIDALGADPTTTSASKVGAVALGLDVWLLGEDEPRDGWHHSWITHDDSGFVAARRRMSQMAIGPSGRPCWSTAAPRPRSLHSSAWCARCGCHASRSRWFTPSSASSASPTSPSRPRWADRPKAC